MLILPLLPSKANAITLDDIEYYQKEQAQEQAERFKAEQQLLSDQLMAKAQKLKGKYGGSCVDFVKDFTNTPRRTKWTRDGYARTIEINSHVPQVGDIIITKESKSGHAGRVISTSTPGKVIFVDSNYEKDIITIRELDINSPKIKGYNNKLLAKK